MPYAIIPQKGSRYAAGYDLHSVEETMVPGRGKALVKTGLSFAIPTGNYGRIAPRSGLALKFGIDTGAGVIDSDYRGEVHVLLFNHSDKDFKGSRPIRTALVNKGDRIAQMIIEKITDTEIVVTDKLPVTERGDLGFGSTGVKASIVADKSQRVGNIVEAMRNSGTILACIIMRIGKENGAAGQKAGAI